MKKEKVTPFQKKVYAACGKIPAGRVSTYSEISRAIGHLKSARAVGNALNKNPFAPRVPCHRVVKNDGTLGGFASGEEKKRLILKKEGLRVEKGKIVDFEKKLFRF